MVVIGEDIISEIHLPPSTPRPLRKQRLAKFCLGVLCVLGGESSYAVSSFSNVSASLSSGFTFSSSASSSSRGGGCGAESSNSIASFQLIVPCPGHRCESLFLSLS